MKISLVIMLALMITSLGCGQHPSSPPPIVQPTPRQISLAEANKILDKDLPMPSYLPDNLELTAIYLIGEGANGAVFNLVFYPKGSTESGNISNAKDNAPIWMNEVFYAEGVGHLPPSTEKTEIYDINGVAGYWIPGVLAWYDKNWLMDIFPDASFPKEDIVKMARSVNMP